MDESRTEEFGSKSLSRRDTLRRSLLFAAIASTFLPVGLIIAFIIEIASLSLRVRPVTVLPWFGFFPTGLSVALLPLATSFAATVLVGVRSLVAGVSEIGFNPGAYAEFKSSSPPRHFTPRYKLFPLCQWGILYVPESRRADYCSSVGFMGELFQGVFQRVSKLGSVRGQLRVQKVVFVSLVSGFCS